MNARFDNEYCYYATALIFGVHSPKVREFSVHSFDVMRHHKDLSFSEYNGLNASGRLESRRRLVIDQDRQLMTGLTQMSSSVNKALMYIDGKHQINISDAIFHDEEVNYFCEDWNSISKNKVEKLALLIGMLHMRTIEEIPLLINEFPEISRVILAFPQYVLPFVSSS